MALTYNLTLLHSVLYLNNEEIITLWNPTYKYVISYGFYPQYFSIKHSGEFVWKY